jgi:hypothetical protein
MRSISLLEYRGGALVGFEHVGVFPMKNLMPFDHFITVSFLLNFFGHIFSDSFSNANTLIRKQL